MPVTRIGDWCSRCGKRPAITDGLCRPCENLLRAFGHLPSGERLSRFDALLDSGFAHRAEDPEFDSELQRWLGEAA